MTGRKILLGVVILLLSNQLLSQHQTPALIGYWHNWKSARSGDIALASIDNRYTVIIIAFAMPADTNMTMKFSPFDTDSKTFIKTIRRFQQQGKQVLLSIGGATCSIDLTHKIRKENFVNSLLKILTDYPFDGLDINIEHGLSIINTGGTIANPANVAQMNLIEAIREIMQEYNAIYRKKMVLTIAPETAGVQGGQSKFTQNWGAYLPLIDALRDSIDMVQVQLYNSGSMYDLNRKERFQGTPEFVVAMTEVLIQGIPTQGGFFKGLPAGKVAVGIPACRAAAGGGYIDTAILAACMRYLTGRGTQLGTYLLKQKNGYSDLGGLMVWSLNWEANAHCDGAYMMANMFENLFSAPPPLLADNNFSIQKCFPLDSMPLDPIPILPESVPIKQFPTKPIAEKPIAEKPIAEKLEKLPAVNISKQQEKALKIKFEKAIVSKRNRIEILLPQQHFSITITNKIGQPLFEQADVWEFLKIKTRKFSAGVYTLILSTDISEQYSKKIVVQ